MGAEPNEAVVEKPEVKAAIIACKGMIDEGLYKSIGRRTQIALDEGAEYLIFEIGTYGGLLESADKIAEFLILDIPGLSKKARTVAYITTKAISAGAMISVSCQDIIMLENTTIGDCAPIAIGGKLEGVEREKAESFIRAAFDRAAEANGYPAALLRAMVSMQVQVYKVENRQTGQYEFFESEQLPKDPNKHNLEDKELVVKDDELLTLTASQAHEYGIARAKVKDLTGALDFLAERDGVTFAGEPIELRTNWSEELVRWLNSPIVFSILFMIALLGVYVELNTPGVGLPGLVAVICFAVLFGSKYLTGMANWIEVALFIVGVLLLFVEIFVTPGFGILGVLGILCMLAGLLGMLVGDAPEELPWSPWPKIQSEWDLFTSGALALSFGFIGFVVLAWLVARYLPRFELFSGLILMPAAAKKGTEYEVSMRTLPKRKAVGVKVGDVGEVISTLRPTGRAQFGDAVVDVVAQAEFLDKDTRVEIMEIRGNRVVVKKVDDSE